MSNDTNILPHRVADIGQYEIWFAPGEDIHGDYAVYDATRVVGRFRSEERARQYATGRVLRQSTFTMPEM